MNYIGPKIGSTTFDFRDNFLSEKVYFLSLLLPLQSYGTESVHFKGAGVLGQLLEGLWLCVYSKDFLFKQNAIKNKPA